jgi:nucleotide-binding universal stress UspA family protein
MATVYSKVLCPLDGSDESRRSVGEAIRFARDQHAQLYFLHVVDIGNTLLHLTASQKILEFGRETGRNLLERAAAEASAAQVAAHCEMTEASSGRVADEILEQARRLDADLIVMGIRGRHSSGGAQPGADAKSVMAEARVPVLLVQ